MFLEQILLQKFFGFFLLISEWSHVKNKKNNKASFRSFDRSSPSKNIATDVHNIIQYSWQHINELKVLLSATNERIFDGYLLILNNISLIFNIYTSFDTFSVNNQSRS